MFPLFQLRSILLNQFWDRQPSNPVFCKYGSVLEKVILNQHIVQDGIGTEVYRFWTHFFSDKDLKNILQESGFRDHSFHRDVLPEGDIWNGDNVTFCKTYK